MVLSLLLNTATQNSNDPCPAEVGSNADIMKEFLTISEWSSAREETNTDHLSTSQTSVLKAPEDTVACQQFNNKYQEAISSTWSDSGETYKEYNVTYYGVGDYFFVVISLRQHEGYVSSGVAYIDVYDKNLTLIEGYAF